MLVRIKHHIALASFDSDGNDLGLEAAFFDGMRCTAMRLHGESILLFTSEFPLFNEVLCCNTHMTNAKWIG